MFLHTSTLHQCGHRLLRSPKTTCAHVQARSQVPLPYLRTHSNATALTASSVMTGLTTESTLGDPSHHRHSANRGPRRHSNTTSMDSLDDQLALALDHMQTAEPPVPFAGKYLLVNERIRGSQALVQARSPGAAGAVNC